MTLCGRCSTPLSHVTAPDHDCCCDGPCGADIPIGAPMLACPGCEAGNGWYLCKRCCDQPPHGEPQELDELIDDLIFAARAGDTDEVRAALASGAPVDGRDANRSTALMMAAANGHADALRELMGAGADVNAINSLGNTALHWAVFTSKLAAVEVLLASGGCDLMLRNAAGNTAAMDAERAGKGDLVVALLESLDEDAAAAALGIEEEEGEEEVVASRLVPAEVVPRLEEVCISSGADAAAAPCAGGACSADAAAPPIVLRERPPEPNGAVAARVAAAVESRTGDSRYSVLPAVVEREEVLGLSREFFQATSLLTKDGNTFGPDFEQQYSGHKNYFYYMNRNKVLPGAEAAAATFERLDAACRLVVEQHHPGVRVKLERAFGAYYEGERDGFHRGVNEHCDGEANLVSTVVHAVLPDGEVGFESGGELTVAASGGLPPVAIPHSNDTVGTVVYLGAGVYHHATPIQEGGRRLVFCLFYAAAPEKDLTRHALA